jgi:CHAD domain-containing protein
MTNAEERMLLHEDLFDPAAPLKLERLRKRALKRGRGLLQQPPEERHEVRIVLKNIRYTAEFFSSFFAGVRPYIRAVAKLQDGLGAFNDAASATHHLRDVEAAAGPQAAKAAGVVLGWREARRTQTTNYDKHGSPLSEPAPFGADQIVPQGSFTPIA